MEINDTVMIEAQTELHAIANRGVIQDKDALHNAIFTLLNITDSGVNALEVFDDVHHELLRDIHND
jgi:uncharacterized protein YfkK (UPF0435 family)